MVRAFAPSVFVPEVCSLSSRLGPGDWSFDVDGLLVTPWALADIARVSLVHGNEHRRRQASVKDVLRCVRAHNELDDPDLMQGQPDAFQRFFLRVAAQQLDFQLSPIPEMARVAAMCATLTDRAPEVMSQGWDIELLGCALDEYLAVGQFLLYSHVPNHGRFSTSFFNHPQIEGLFGSLNAAGAQKIYRKNFVQDVLNLKRETAPNDRPAPYRRFTYNPLLAKPVISGLGDMDYLPVAALVIRKLSPIGLYYAGLRHFGEGFARDLGHLFEQYVGRNLRLNKRAKVFPEILYGKERRRSVDWIVVTPTAVVLVEAKSVRPTEEVRTGGADAAGAIQRMLKKAGGQIDRTSQEIEERTKGFDHIPKDLPRVGVIATLGDFHVLNAAPVKDYTGLMPRTPTVIASIGEIESAVVHTEDLGEFMLGVALQDPADGNSVQAAMSKLEPRKNPILIDAWESSILNSMLANLTTEGS